ncbi:hypothetical protein [Tabrizicola oligotrophica]|uniref:Sulfotransferase family protein n=1 Tax=Tabrizicola oligotrophica TaxID=2710650 RepID=A0A6M0QRL3_9RHOB|nr:hypothetical protein [Tabrizicola oligotrophica]NEY89072.1 hypothetical protein [Tabrizicola oligotrophica]
MVQEIVIHLGDCKTGTTSIQSALAEDLFTVQGRSYVYPAQMNHNPMADCLRGKGNSELVQERWGRLSDRIRHSDSEIAIISAENFEFVRPTALAEALDRFFPEFKGRIRMIAYVRPHAERLVSSYAERSKQGKFHGDVEAAHDHFLANGLLTYLPRFTRWREVFGDAFHVRPMIRDRLKGGDVVRDFLDFAFEGAEIEIDSKAIANESLSIADLMAMRRLHQRLDESKQYGDELPGAVGWNFASFLSSLPKTASFAKPYMHRSLAEKVRSAYMEDAKAMDAAFFQGSPLADALEASVNKAPSEIQSLKIEDYFSADAIRVIDGIGHLMRRVMEADPMHFRMAVRPEKLRPAQIQGALSNVGKRRAGKRRAGRGMNKRQAEV